MAVARQGPSHSVDGATSLANLFGKEDIESDHVTTGSFLGSKGPRNGFSMFHELSTTIGVGCAKGYFMKGQEKDLRGILKNFGENGSFK